MSYNELKQHGTADFPIELYQIDKTHPKYEMASHWHSQIEIIKILDGELNIRLNNHEYTARKNDIIFVNSETVHGAEPKDCVYVCLVFHPEFLEISDNSSKFFIESLINHEYVINEFFGSADTPFHRSVDSIFEAMTHKSSGYKFMVIGALYQMFGTIINCKLYNSAENLPYITGDKNVPKLKKVLTFIRKNYDSQISLDDMAAAAGMSPKYFCYFFRDMTKKTPVEYLNSYRIEKASRKLLNTDNSVTDIAFSCGFNDLSYFIKTFKSIKGITPAKFRKI
ncbi:MAG: AraC family transcriptional regulator [Clostridia bacterium]|nr:AraC family transcriptional regulator [Clostridia bacterium]